MPANETSAKVWHVLCQMPTLALPYKGRTVKTAASYASGLYFSTEKKLLGAGARHQYKLRKLYFQIY
ncbi:hypothetical protein D0469_03980 [Peribacillus saganii]|uniref:Uncharacterized protein n=1 Tax=Peribacillus saganii TaxID=2303992 RepID=A0A372LT82_9BACI|nr:hypothetical protein D0469_03980 [Peribacillus saganii]